MQNFRTINFRFNLDAEMHALFERTLLAKCVSELVGYEEISQHDIFYCIIYFLSLDNPLLSHCIAKLLGKLEEKTESEIGMAVMMKRKVPFLENKGLFPETMDHGQKTIKMGDYYIKVSNVSKV